MSSPAPGFGARKRLRGRIRTGMGAPQKRRAAGQQRARSGFGYKEFRATAAMGSLWLRGLPRNQVVSFAITRPEGSRKLSTRQAAAGKLHSGKPNRQLMQKPHGLCRGFFWFLILALKLEACSLPLGLSPSDFDRLIICAMAFLRITIDH